jgi:hypothetical protein
MATHSSRRREDVDFYFYYSSWDDMVHFSNRRPEEKLKRQNRENSCYFEQKEMD